MFVTVGPVLLVMSDELQAYSRIKDELSVESGCVIWGIRVVIPCKLRPILLRELHSDHLGTSRIKAVARSFFWWPKLDDDITRIAASCESCQQYANKPQSADMHHLIYPSHPMQRCHVDFAEFLGVHYLLIVDAYSKWVDVHVMGKSTTAARTVECLQVGTLCQFLWYSICVSIGQWSSIRLS